jgi:hypothetical protein
LLSWRDAARPHPQGWGRFFAAMKDTAVPDIEDIEPVCTRSTELVKPAKFVD